MNQSNHKNPFLTFVPETSPLFRLLKQVYTLLEWLLIVVVFLVAIVPGVTLFVALAFVLNRYTPFAIEAAAVVSLLVLIFLARVLQRYMNFYDRFVFSTTCVPVGQFALGKIGERDFRLDQSGFYVLKPRAWVYFMGTEEDYGHFDPLAL